MWIPGVDFVPSVPLSDSPIFPPRTLTPDSQGHDTGKTGHRSRPDPAFGGGASSVNNSATALNSPTANKVAWGDSSQQPTRWCGVTALNSQQGCVGCPHPEHCSTVALCPTAQRRHRISCAPPQLKNTPQDSNYTPSSNLCDQCPVGEYSSSTSSSKGSQ